MKIETKYCKRPIESITITLQDWEAKSLLSFLSGRELPPYISDIKEALNKALKDE